MGNQHPYKESVEKNSYKVINCQQCGYWHVYPIPSEERLNSYYKSKYYHTLNNNPTMTDKIDDPDGFYRMQYENRLRHIVKILPTDLPKTLIDIGVGYGDFLLFMKNNGWRVSGLEPSQYASQFVRDKSLGVKIGNVEQIYAEFKPASLVTLNNVLEHVRQPQKILEIIRGYLLLPKGIVSISIPNDFNVLQELAMRTIHKDCPEKQYYWVAPPDHLNYWSLTTIRRFLKRCRFDVINVMTDFPMEFFILMGDDYVNDAEVGRTVHLKRVQFEKNLQKNNHIDLKDLLFGALASLGIGRSIHVLATPSGSNILETDNDNRYFF